MVEDARAGVGLVSGVAVPNGTGRNERKDRIRTLETRRGQALRKVGLRDVRLTMAEADSRSLCVLAVEVD